MGLFFLAKVCLDFDTLHVGDVKLSLLLIKNWGLIRSVQVEELTAHFPIPDLIIVNLAQWFQGLIYTNYIVYIQDFQHTCGHLANWI